MLDDKLVYTVRHFIELTEEQIWQLPLIWVRVQFDDETVLMRTEQIQISWYYWILHREFPGATVKASHRIVGDFHSGVHLNLGASIFWDIFEEIDDGKDILQWDMSKVFYELTNALHNATLVELSPYVITLDMYDVLEVFDHPVVKNSKEKYLKTVQEFEYAPPVVEKAIDEVYGNVSKLLFKSNGEMPNNGFKLMAEAGIIKKGQTLQFIGPRGYAKDIDSEVFPLPIDVGYGEGLTTLYDHATESRSAATSLCMNTRPLENSETWNRYQQLHCSSVERVVGVSCDRWVTVDWDVAAGEESLLYGKNFMDGNKVVMITPYNFKSLIGKTIKMRDTVGCGNHDPQTVCKTCLGWVSRIVPPHSNLGWSLSTELNGKLSQRMLSNKHYEGSSSTVYLKMTDSMRKWIRLGKEDESEIYLVSKQLERARGVYPRVRIPDIYTPRINHILETSIDELSPMRLSSCKSIYVAKVDASGNELTPYEEINTTVVGTGAFLTTETLKYMKEHGWTTRDGYIEISLDKWNFDDKNSEMPFMMTPRRGDNMMVYLEELKSFILSSGSKNDDSEKSNITKFKTRRGALSEFAEIVRSKIDVNMWVISVFIRSCMCISKENEDYRLPTLDDPFEFVNAHILLRKRSLSTALAYTGQRETMIDPYWYESKPRMRHMLDPIFLSPELDVSE